MLQKPKIALCRGINNDHNKSPDYWRIIRFLVKKRLDRWEGFGDDVKVPPPSLESHRLMTAGSSAVVDTSDYYRKE